MIESLVIANFEVGGEFISAVPYGSGHINDTRLVTMLENGEEKQYVLQRINHNVFKKPDELMENYVGVTSYLKDVIEKAGGDPMRETLNVIKTKDGKNFYLSEEGKCYAEAVYEKHCIIRDYLTACGVSPASAEEDACRMEHLISEETFSMMKNFLKR